MKNNQDVVEKIKMILDGKFLVKNSFKEYLNTENNYLMSSYLKLELGGFYASYDVVYNEIIDRLYKWSIENLKYAISVYDVYKHTNTKQPYYTVIRSIHEIVKNNPEYLKNLPNVSKVFNEIEQLNILYWGTTEVVMNIYHMILINSKKFPDKKCNLLYKNEDLMYLVLDTLSKENRDILKNFRIKNGSIDDYRCLHFNIMWEEEDFLKIPINIRQDYISRLILKVFDKENELVVVDDKHFNYRLDKKIVKLLVDELLIDWNQVVMDNLIPINQTKNNIKKF